MCGEKNGIFKCRNCLQDFCHNDFNNHLQELSKELEELEVIHDIFQQITGPQKHPLIEKIINWERDLINKSRQTTKETRQRQFKHTVTYMNDIEIKLTDQGNGRGNKLNPFSFLQHIYVDDDDDQTIYIDSLNDYIMDWKCNANNGPIVAGGNGQGNQPEQLKITTDVIIDKANDSLIICNSGTRQWMLWFLPKSTIRTIIISDRDYWSLTMDKNRYLYVSDTEKHEDEAIENRRLSIIVKILLNIGI